MGKIRVLIADDNMRSAGLMEEAIKKDKEIEVIGKAEDGMDALEQIRDKEPDVVLLDLIMPKLDGLGVMEHVKKDVTLKKSPSFIVITGIGQEVVTESAFELGASYYMLKPFDYQLVISRIKQLRGVSSYRRLEGAGGAAKGGNVFLERNYSSMKHKKHYWNQFGNNEALENSIFGYDAHFVREMEKPMKFM